MIHTADPTPYLHTLPTNWTVALLLLLTLTVASVTAAIVWQTRTPRRAFTLALSPVGHPR